MSTLKRNLIFLT
jgi:hypothetical protein